MTQFDVLLRAPLAVGAHNSWDGKQCVMERVSMLWAQATGQNVAEVFSDLPACTNQVVARVAQVTNDYLSDEDRQKLNKLLPRLLRARRTDSDPRINVRLAVWAAKRVLHLVREQDRERCEQAIRAAEVWLEEPSAHAAHAINAVAHAAVAHAAVAYAAVAAYDAANAVAYAANNAAHHANNAVNNAVHHAAHAAHAAYAIKMSDDPILFLDELLDAWEEAVTKENEDLYTWDGSRTWEDDALKFIAEYMGEDGGSDSDRDLSGSS